MQEVQILEASGLNQFFLMNGIVATALYFIVIGFCIAKVTGRKKNK